MDLKHVLAREKKKFSSLVLHRAVALEILASEIRTNLVEILEQPSKRIYFSLLFELEI